MIQAPTAPVSLISDKLSALIPPIAYTGTDECAQMSSRNEMPCGGNPFLH